jgi:hypothetical protein
LYNNNKSSLREHSKVLITNKTNYQDIRYMAEQLTLVSESELNIQSQIIKMLKATNDLEIGKLNMDRSWFYDFDTGLWKVNELQPDLDKIIQIIPSDFEGIEFTGRRYH